MKSVSINGIARVDLGKKFAKQIRKDENVPCVIYGGSESPVHFYAHANEFRKVVYTPNVYLIDIQIGEKVFKTVMGDIQFHPVTDKILHIDFLRIFDGQPVNIAVPVTLSGNSIGVRNGGRLALNMRKLALQALSEHLPEAIEIDITNLKIGHAIRVSDLSRDNIIFLNNVDDVIVAVKTARAALADEEEEESTEEASDTAESAGSSESKEGAGDSSE